ncbi:RDD family protein [Alkalibaculum sporogenes]|nr:RDD family protein [Alkalibaculum sporogenes]
MEDGDKENLEAPGIALRCKELFLDWLFISAYLLLLLIITLTNYLLIFNEIPVFTNVQSQLIAAFTSIVPLIIIFSIMEGKKHFASWGKRKTNLKVIYKGNPMKGSIIRNTLKFLPWQFGHMSTINGIYNDFDSPFSLVSLSLSITLAIVYILMVFVRKDNRHIADLLSGSTVVKVVV